ncbi:hypothetical protein ACJX0J_011614 [Zea mays]
MPLTTFDDGVRDKYEISIFWDMEEGTNLYPAKLFLKSLFVNSVVLHTNETQHVGKGTNLYPAKLFLKFCGYPYQVNFFGGVGSDKDVGVRVEFGISTILLYPIHYSFFYLVFILCNIIFCDSVVNLHHLAFIFGRVEHIVGMELDDLHMFLTKYGCHDKTLIHYIKCFLFINNLGMRNCFPIINDNMQFYILLFFFIYHV